MKKGLIFRELYLMRKNYISFFLIWLIIAVIGILIPLSIKYGNLANMSIGESTEQQLQIFNIYLYVPTIVLMVCLKEPSLIFSDFKSGWSLFQVTTPLSEREYSTAKYTLQSILMLAALVLNLINNLVICKLYDQPFTRTIFGTMMFIALLAQSVSILTNRNAYIARQKNKAAARIMGKFVVAYVLAAAALIVCDSMFSLEQISAFKNVLVYWFNRIVTFSAPILPFLLAASLFVGRNVFARTMKRRDF